MKGHRVRIPRQLVRQLIASIPEEFDYHARNPERTVRVGGRNMIFGPAYGKWITAAVVLTLLIVRLRARRSMSAVK